MRQTSRIFSPNSPNKPDDSGVHVFGRPIGLVAIVCYKALWGVAYVAVGVLSMLSGRIIAGELAEDPTDLFARWLLSHIHIDSAGFLRAGMFIAALGLMDVVLAVGIWHRSWQIRNALLILFLVIAAFATYHLSLVFSWIKLSALFADFFIVFYLWKILPKHLNDVT